MTTAGPLGRDSMAFRDKMAKYHAAMETALYAAEQNCPLSEEVELRYLHPHIGDLSCTYQDVPFECPYRDYNALCTIPRLRRLIGDHVQQHDCMVPPCQCAGDCGCNGVKE